MESIPFSITKTKNIPSRWYTILTGSQYYNIRICFCFILPRVVQYFNCLLDTLLPIEHTRARLLVVYLIWGNGW